MEVVSGCVVASRREDTQEHISREVLKGQKTKDALVDDQLHIRTHEGVIREDLPLDGLIEVCKILNQILKQLQR